MSNVKFAVIIRGTMHVEGDERSRKNPGHGYPAHTVDTTEFLTFENEAAMLAWIEREEKSQYGKKKYTPIRYTELKVNTHISLSVNVDE